jgi:hypothetical protein
MAYDLSSFYNNTLSSNYLSKTIVDQLMSDSRFSSVSKIVLNGTNYSSGSANSDPIGYTETGRPIYDSSVGITMNDELKDAITKKHARNTDTMLRGIGTNVVENTSTGNIAAFISNGSIKAIITEDGRFTGKVRLENIEDLSKLTLDTSRFYIKAEVDSLLSAKLSRSALFNSDNKINSELIDADIVRHVDFDPHFGDDIRHITNNERQAWNLKYDKPTGGVPMDDLAGAVQDRIKASALSTDLVTHTGNPDIHTSTTERAKWNAKYDKPSTGIPMTDFSEIVQNAINSAAKAADLKAHKENEVAHLTSDERAKWNAKYDKPAGGVPMSHLEQFVQDTIEAAATDADLEEHVNNDVAHVTNAERLSWNGKYVKPSTGVPMTDLDSSLQTEIKSAAKKTELDTHASNTTVHISETERQAWNGHKADGVIHITSTERGKWNAKYDRPSTGIPETDLTAGLQTKINGMVTNTDFNSHATDSVRHVTQSERDAWRAKYDKPAAGVPMEDLDEDVADLINNAATSAALDAHETDASAHVSAAERASWNGKYAKPSTGIPETDFSDNFRTKVAGLATSAALASHAGDAIKHITADERSRWNGKYTKPETGIAGTDLDAALKSKIDNSASAAEFVAHSGNTEIHVTEDERETWNGQYTKPVTGIPETDLEQAFLSKVGNMVSNTDFNEHSTDTTKHVTSSERAAWNGKYAKPSTGIPATDLTEAVQGQIAGAATLTALNSHKADAVAHTSSAERTKWNAKYDKPVEGIPATDLSADVTGNIDAAVDHAGNTSVHVTVEQKVEWSDKYDKPAEGIPAADLAKPVTDDISAAVAHAANADAHVTADEKAAWNAKYDKPADGIAAADLVAELQAKLNALSVPYTKTVDAATPVASVTILASEHNISRNAFEYGVTAYAQNGDFWETVTPSLVRVNEATKDIEVQFTAAFAGKIVIR